MAAILVGHLVRRVRTIERQIHEEGPIAAVGDELHGRVGNHVANVAVGLHPCAIVPQGGVEISAVFIDWVGWIARLGQPAPVEHQRLLETLVHGSHGVGIAQMPFAEDPRAIAGGGEHVRHGGFVGVHHRAAQEGIDDSRAIVVAAGHQAGPGGRANGHHVEVHQRRALCRQAVDVRRMDQRVAGGPQLAKALIVGKDYDHVGPSACFGGVPRSTSAIDNTMATVGSTRAAISGRKRRPKVKLQACCLEAKGKNMVLPGVREG